MKLSLLLDQVRGRRQLERPLEYAEIATDHLEEIVQIAAEHFARKDRSSDFAARVAASHREDMEREP